MQPHLLAVEDRLLGVAAAVVRGEVVGGELLAQVEQRVVRVAVVLGEPRPLGQPLHVEPLEEHELQVARGEDGRRRGGGGHAPTLPGRQRGAGAAVRTGRTPPPLGTEGALGSFRAYADAGPPEGEPHGGPRPAARATTRPPRVDGCASRPGTSTPSAPASTASRRSLQRHEIDVLALQETKAREDQLPLMGLQALGYDIAVAGLNQWNGVAMLSAGSASRTSRSASTACPGGATPWRRSRVRSAPPAAACASGRSTSPTAASPTTRTTPTSSTGWPACARPRAAGSTARPRWSATGTSAPPTTTSSTSSSSRSRPT